MEKEFIYVRNSKYYESLQVIKIGKTFNMINRESTYKTGDPKLGSYPLVIEVYKKDNVEEKIEQKFKKFNIIWKGGTEFYKSSVLELILPFLEISKIKFRIIDEEEKESMSRFKYDNQIIIDIDKQIEELQMKKEKAIIGLYIQKEIEITEEEDTQSSEEEPESNIKPRDYQIEIINKTLEHFKTNSKGLLVEPCGVGKSYIASWIGSKLKIKSAIFGIPSISLIRQWKKTLKNVFTKHIFKTICCEEKETSPEYIKKFIQKNKQIIILTTYMSSRKILKACNELNFKFDYMVLDECHHLTSGDKEKIEVDKFNYVQILKIKSKYQLSLTATIKELEKEEFSNVISNDNKEYFGKIIDERCLNWAIEKDILCDYQIITLYKSDFLALADYFQILKGEEKLFMSANSALKCIEMNYSKNILLYTNNVKNSRKIIEYMEGLLQKGLFKFDFDIYMSSYDSKYNKEDRRKIMDNFEKANYGILSSVFTLGEGWDCPKLDTVVFAEEMTSSIRILQSALRSGRKNKNDISKISKIVIPIENDINLLNDKSPDYIKVKDIIIEMGKQDNNITGKVKFIDISKNVKKLKQPPKETNKQGNKIIENIMLEVKNRLQLGISYEKAKKIIKETKIQFSKDSYRDYCNKDVRLPNDPELTFKRKINWVDYLGISRDYYDIDKCKSRINSFLENIEYDIDLNSIAKKIKTIDDKFPPHDLWCDYYNVHDLGDLIKFNDGEETVLF